MSNMNTAGFTIRIEGLEGLADAIDRLAAAMGAPEKAAPVSMPGAQSPVQQNPVSAQGQNPAAQPVQMQGQIPVAPPVQMQGQIPVTPPAQMQGQIPTTAVPAAYTCDQLAVAASQLVNAGKQMRLHEILHGFGVNSLMELPQ